MSSRLPQAPIKAPLSRARPTSAAVAIAGAASLAVAMGIGRFAFTPLLPMMLHDGTLNLAQGSNLATANYLGYLLGAMLCMGLPRIWPSALLIRLSLSATVLLTIAMALPQPAPWMLLRFLAGVATAIAFVYTSEWCLAELMERGTPALGSAIYAGPGAGIAVSGLAASAMVAFGWAATAAWISFAALAALIIVSVWPIFRGGGAARSHPLQQELQRASPGMAPATGGAMEMTLFAVAYCLAGFGYIITATFLPVIAGNVLPGSPWLALFWPVFGICAAAGSLLVARNRTRVDPRLFLVVAYLCQALGVVLTLLLPSAAGFAISSALVGLPFTAITFFAMQEVRRLRPHHAARFMGLLTALYGIGQISGPPLTGLLLARMGSVQQGFALALAIASATLVAGAVFYLVMISRWPVSVAGKKASP